MLEKITGFPKKVSGFYGDVKSELKKVTWPARNEVYGTTIVVLAAVFFFGIYLFLVDQVLQAAVQRIFNFFL
jgi:preprotein translocase subunit SecE